MTIAWTTPRTWVTGETPASGLFNTYARDNGDYLTGETAWTPMSPLTNGWVYFGSPFAVPAYRKIGDMVWLKGLVKSGTASSAIFTLPVGYRPTAEIACPNISNNAFAIVTVQSTGVVASTGSNVWLSLDTTMFSTLA